MRVLVLLASILLVPLAGSPARAETLAEFAARITAAFAASDKTGALAKLFYLDGVDPGSRAIYEKRIIGRMLARKTAPSVTFEALPLDFDPVYVSNGYEYRPNLEPLGFAVLNKMTRIVFGVRGGRHYFTGVTRVAVNPGGPPDKMVQMTVIGMGQPPVRFEGHCDVMLSNGRLKRMTLQDNGNGNTTAIIMAQHIAACDLTNLTGRGSLSLRLQEGDAEIFNSRITVPEAKITYRR